MIDVQRLETLEREIGPEAYSEVVTMFFGEVEARLESMASTNNVRRVENDIHFIKGCSLNMGFNALSALCDDLAYEKTKPAEPPKALLRRCYERSKAEFYACKRDP